MAEALSTQASVFISYSHRDEEFAESLRAAFLSAGREAWRDKDNIRPVAKWAQEISVGIDKSDVTVFILTPNFVASQECVKEIKHAAGQNKRLIPVKAQAVDPHSVHPALAELQWVSFCDGATFDEAFAVLTRALDTDLDWLTEHTRYHVRAVEWEGRERSTALVLRGSDLRQAESWLARAADKDPKPSLLQSQFIAAGRQAATKTQRLVAGALGTGLVIAVVLAVFAYLQRNEAREARDEALHRLYASQLARAQATVDTDPVMARDTLFDTLQSAGALREFTWDLYRQLSERTLLALGGAWNGNPQFGDDEAGPVFAISEDGMRVATAAVRRTKHWEHGERAFACEILVWDVATGGRIATLTLAEGHRADDVRVADIVFAPDGRRLVASAGSRPSVLKVWDIETAQELASMTSEDIKALAFAPRERLIAVADYDKVLVWDALTSQTAPRVLTAAYPEAFAFDAERDELVTIESRDVVRWNLTTGARMARRSPTNVQKPVAISRGGERIARIEHDAIATWRSTANGAEWTTEHTLRGQHAEIVTSIAFSPDGRTLASGGNDNTVRLWDLERGVATLTLRGPKGDVTVLGFSADGRRLVAAAEDATVFVWDIAGRPLRPTQRVEAAVARGDCVAASAARGTLLTTAEGTVSLHSAAGHSQLMTAAKRAWPCGLAAGGGAAFALTGPAQVSVWNTNPFAPRATLDGISEPDSVRLSPSGAVAAGWLDAQKIGVWSTMTGKLKGSIGVDGKLAAPLEFIDETLLVGQIRNGEQSRVTLWDTVARRVLTSVTVPTGDISALCPAKRLYASAATLGDLRIIDLATGALVRDKPWYERGFPALLRTPTALVFSSDCATLFVGDDVQGEVSAWDVDSGERRYAIAAHSGGVLAETRGSGTIGVSSKGTGDGVTAIAVTPDGITLATGGGSIVGRGELRLWNAQRGERLGELPVTGGSVRALSFTADADRLGARIEPANREPGSVHALDLWSLSTGREVALFAAHAEPIITITFSPDGTLRSETHGDYGRWDVSRSDHVRRLRDWPRVPAAWRPPDRSLSSVRTAADPDGRFQVLVAQERFLVLTRKGEYGERVLRPGEDGKSEYHRLPIHQLRLLGDGRLVSLAGDGSSGKRPVELVLWDLDAGVPLREAYSGNLVAEMHFAPDESFFVTIGAVGPVLDHPGVIDVWETSTLRHLGTLSGHRSRVQAAAFSPDGARLATGDIEGFIRIWDVSRFRRAQ